MRALVSAAAVQRLLLYKGVSFLVPRASSKLFSREEMLAQQGLGIQGCQHLCSSFSCQGPSSWT